MKPCSSISPDASANIAAVAASWVGAKFTPFKRRKAAMDRRLAGKNLRTGLIAGAICFFGFGIAFVVAAVY